MFSLTERAESVLLSREVKEDIDEYVLKLFVAKNKHHAEFAFFKNDLVCSWCAKGKSDNFSSEVLYVLGEKNRDLQECTINEIFKESAALFKIPDYPEYIQYMQQFINSPDIIRNIIDYLSVDSKGILPEEEYEAQAEKILKSMSQSFQKGIHFQDNHQLFFIENQRDEKKINIQEKKLAFMGNYCFGEVAGSLKKLLEYKILEKVYGTNEVDSVYFPLRCEGKIYTAISSYVMHKEVFLTGVLADYKESLLQQTLELAQGVEISEEVFLSARRRLIEDIKFVAFQYGDDFALLPYIYAVKREIKMEEILTEIMKITLEDVEKLAKQEMSVIAMGVKT